MKCRILRSRKGEEGREGNADRLSKTGSRRAPRSLIPARAQNWRHWGSQKALKLKLRVVHNRRSTKKKTRERNPPQIIPAHLKKKSQDARGARESTESEKIEVRRRPTPKKGGKGRALQENKHQLQKDPPRKDPLGKSSTKNRGLTSRNRIRNRSIWNPDQRAN